MIQLNYDWNFPFIFLVFDYTQWFITPVDPNTDVEDEDVYKAQIRLGGASDSKCLTVGPVNEDGAKYNLWIWDCLEGLKDQEFLVTNSNPSLLEALEEYAVSDDMPVEDLMRPFEIQEKKRLEEEAAKKAEEEAMLAAAEAAAKAAAEAEAEKANDDSAAEGGTEETGDDEEGAGEDAEEGEEE